MTDFEKIQKINRLAKALKDAKMANTNDEAAKMAEEMYEKSEKNIAEMRTEDITAQELIEEEYKTRPEYKKKVELKESIKDIKEHIKKQKEGELEENIEESDEDLEEQEKEEE